MLDLKYIFNLIQKMIKPEPKEFYWAESKHTHVNNFVNTYYPIILEEVNETNSPKWWAFVVLAQMALETGWGRSQMLLDYNIALNIKSHSETDDRVLIKDIYEYDTNGNKITKNDYFVRFKSVSQSIYFYLHKIYNDKRYYATAQSVTYINYLHNIEKAGYATDSITVNSIYTNRNAITLTDSAAKTYTYNNTDLVNKQGIADVLITDVKKGDTILVYAKKILDIINRYKLYNIENFWK